MNITQTSRQIVADIEAYMAQFRQPSSAWYVGIATDPRRRLFIDHAVDEKNGTWIYQNAGADRAARSIEAHFLSKGCRGGDGGGDYTTTSVYAYLITPNTRE